MTFNEWINDVLSKDLICDDYRARVLSAKSKKQFMDIVLEANGLEYLCKAKTSGYGLPYDTILREFAPFINGNYDAKIERGGDKWYTSTMFVKLDEKSEVRVANTATGLFGCSCRVYIPKNKYVQLYVDDECELDIYCPSSSKCYLAHCGGAKIKVSEGEDRVIFEEI